MRGLCRFTEEAREGFYSSRFYVGTLYILRSKLYLALKSFGEEGTPLYMLLISCGGSCALWEQTENNRSILEAARMVL